MIERAKVSERIIEGCCRTTDRDQTSEVGASTICPMSGMCAGFAGRMRTGMFLVVAGIIMIGFGVSVLVEPRMLIWLLAGAAIVMGAAALIGAVAARRWGARPTRP